MNEHTAKPHKLVRPGDVVEVALPAGTKRLRLLATTERRGPAAVARQLYEDLTPPPPPPMERVAEVAQRDRGAGRPTKRERRQMVRLRDW